MNYNLTTLFALPLLQLNNNAIRKRLVGSYVKTDTNDFDDDKLLLLIKNTQTIDYLDLYDSLITNSYCEGDYDYHDTQYSLLVYNMSSFDDYYKFKNGQYTKYSEWAKKLCMNAGFHDIKVQHIFNKEEIRREFLEKHFGLEKGSLKDAEELASKWDSDVNTNILTQEIINKLPNKNGKLQSKKTTSY